MKYCFLACCLVMLSCSKKIPEKPKATPQERRLVVEGPDTLYIPTHAGLTGLVKIPLPVYKAYDEYGADITEKVHVSAANTTRAPAYTYWRYQMITFSLPDVAGRGLHDTVYVRLTADDKPAFRTEVMSQDVRIFESSLIGTTHLVTRVYLYQNPHKTAEIKFSGDFPFASNEFKVLATYTEEPGGTYTLEIGHMERTIDGEHGQEVHVCHTSTALLRMAPDSYGRMRMFGALNLDLTILNPGQAPRKVYNRGYSFD